MLRADLQEEHSAAQRQDPAGEGAALVPVQDSDVVRDGDTYYLVINNLGEQCLRTSYGIFPKSRYSVFHLNKQFNPYRMSL